MGFIYPNAHVTAARVASKDPIMLLTAERLKGHVLGLAAVHNKTGEYSSRVKVTASRGAAGVRDLHVISTDPQAQSIEFGHWWITPSRIRVKWVKGLFIFRKAVMMMGG